MTLSELLLGLGEEKPVSEHPVEPSSSHGTLNRGSIIDKTLLPCPFCGTGGIRTAIVSNGGTDLAQIWCITCGAYMYARYSVDDDLLNEAKKRWNKRAGTGLTS